MNKTHMLLKFLVKFCSNYVKYQRNLKKKFKFAKFYILDAPFGGRGWAEPLPKYGTTRGRPQSACLTRLPDAILKILLGCS
jgi:hypothetical protein